NALMANTPSAACLASLRWGESAMQKDTGTERVRELVRQDLLSEDELANYPSYGWPVKCPACPAPRGGGNTIRRPECDRVVAICTSCGAVLKVARYGRIVSVSTRARAL